MALYFVEFYFFAYLDSQFSEMDEETSNSARRMSTRSRKVAPKMAAALASSDNRTQAILARLDALESDNAVPEPVQLDDDDEASLDDDDQGSFSRVFC
ncbi:SWR1 complex subunit 6-like [Ipomoea triloba]|uniref:SWR1 complex subunit 6-like n=1 Tax=Ipomoea triloba TaxID=35885 RepID=UPI00125D1C2C|nr:SWR1 complex subunit 6-like [Ipomoea triloba]